MAEETQDHGQSLAKWNFPEFIKTERSKSWYFVAFVIFAFLLIYALVTVNFLFAVIIIISAIIIVMRNRTEPEQVTVELTEDGLAVDNKFYDYDAVRYFYILYKPPELKNLYFEFKAVTKPRLIVPLENQNPLEIRDILNQYLTENLEKEEEPASEALRKLFKL